MNGYSFCAARRIAPFPFAFGAAFAPVFILALALCVHIPQSLFSQARQNAGSSGDALVARSANAAFRSVNPLRNMALLDSVMRLSARAIRKQIQTPLFPQDTLQFRVAAHEASWMLENAVVAEIRPLRRFRESNSSNSPPSVRAFPTLSLRLADAATRYFALQEFDSLAREISCVVVGEVETVEGSVQPLEQTFFVLRDTIARAQLANLESSQYSFARAVPPDPHSNIWKQVIEPAIVILAGALTIALFFFVRTQ
jgi:hypothetical protein